MGTTRTSRIKTNKSEKSEKIIRFLRQNIDTSKVNTNIANMTKGKTGNRVSNLL